MSSAGAVIIGRYRTALDTAATLPRDVHDLRGLDEAEVLEINRLHTDLARRVGSAGAVIAGDLAYRSRPELGGDGLARRTGHRTVEILLKTTTGATKEQVITAVRAGTLLTDIADDGTADPVTGEIREATHPWLRCVAAAVAAGKISTSASGSIASGLGSPNSAVTVAQLEVAAAQLVVAAVSGMDADRLFTTARALRDEMDVAGVKLREDEAHANRGITHYPLPSGGGKAIWTMDPENYALFVDAYDRMTSPKRGGVRFIDPSRAAHADRIRDDDRTHQQLAHDGFMHLLMAGADVDDSVMLGSGAPEVRITVTKDALRTGLGLARIDGQSTPVSIETAQRLLCEATITTIGFDSRGNYVGAGLDRTTVTRTDPDTGTATLFEPGTDSRLFTRRQRRILAVKFGGCMDPDCDRPPAWCEAHHILEWSKDGTTVIRNGILLCKYHHLLYHNGGYQIRVDDTGNYWKIPPTSINPDQTPIPMPFKTRNLQDLTAANPDGRVGRPFTAERIETPTR